VRASWAQRLDSRDSIPFSAEPFFLNSFSVGPLATGSSSPPPYSCTRRRAAPPFKPVIILLKRVTWCGKYCSATCLHASFPGLEGLFEGERTARPTGDQATQTIPPLEFALVRKSATSPLKRRGPNACCRRNDSPISSPHTASEILLLTLNRHAAAQAPGIPRLNAAAPGATSTDSVREPRGRPSAHAALPTVFVTRCGGQPSRVTAAVFPSMNFFFLEVPPFFFPTKIVATLSGQVQILMVPLSFSGREL